MKNIFCASFDGIMHYVKTLIAINLIKNYACLRKIRSNPSKLSKFLLCDFRLRLTDLYMLFSTVQYESVETYSDVHYRSVSRRVW